MCHILIYDLSVLLFFCRSKETLVICIFIYTVVHKKLHVKCFFFFFFSLYCEGLDVLIQ